MRRTRKRVAPKRSATKIKNRVMATRGRPVEKKLPPRIDATPEQMAQAMFALPADHEWQYGPRKVYQCVDCGQAVYYPDTLCQDGRCGACKKALAE